MSAVLGLYRWAAAVGLVSAEMLGTLFELRAIAPGTRGGESGTRRLVKVRELAGERAVTSPPKWLEQRETRHALLAVPMNSRDRFLVALLFVTGIRIGEALSLYRQDMHLLADNLANGCRLSGAHLHVRRRSTSNRAFAKSGHREVPVSVELVHLYDDYRFERAERLGGVDDCPHVFVNLFAGTIGAPMTYDTVRELFGRIGERLDTRVTPHMLRHTRATVWLHGYDDGDPVSVDDVRELLGHASIASTSAYLHPNRDNLRAAVDSAAHAIRGVADVTTGGIA
jgi:integrase/recombinase XerD